MKAIKRGIIKSAHDVSDGGLAINISESLVNADSKLGIKLDIERQLRNDELLFGECQSLIIVSLIINFSLSRLPVSSLWSSISLLILLIY